MTSHPPRNYRVTVDGERIKDIVLEYEQYKTQVSRDIVRAQIAAHYGIPRHYLRLTWLERGWKI